MKSVRRCILACIVILGVTVFGLNLANAKPGMGGSGHLVAGHHHGKPHHGQPWFPENPDEYDFESVLTSNEDLAWKLRMIEWKSRGLAKLDVIGQTDLGTDIYMVKIGNPYNTPVMILTQQHGNEPLPTESALRLIKDLVTHKRKTKSILKKLYVLIIVRANPEGSARYIRGNADFDVPERNSSGCFDDDGNIDPTLLNQGRGVFTTSFTDEDGNKVYSYDMNRYHWEDWSQSWQVLCNPDLPGRHFDPDVNPVTESQVVLDTFNLYNPLWMADFHQQGFYTTEDGRDVTSSIFWPNNEDADESVVDLSKQLCMVMFDHMAKFDYATTTRYPGGTFPGIARNSYGLGGGGSVLVELKNTQEQEEVEMIIEHAYEQMWALLKATADESLFDIDPARIAELPERGTKYYTEEETSVAVE